MKTLDHKYGKSVKVTVLALIVSVMVSFTWVASNGQTTPITALALAPDGQWLSGSDDGLQVHDAKTLKPVKRLGSGLEKIYSINFSPDHKNLAVAGGTPAEIGSVEIFSIETWEKTHTFASFDDIATDCAWLSDDQLVAGSMTGHCCEMSLMQDTAIPFAVHSKGILTLLRLSTTVVVTGGMDHTIGVWDLKDQTMLRVLNNHVDVVNQLALRPKRSQEELGDQPMVVTVSDDATVRFWQPTIGRMVRFARLESIPTCVLWNHSGTQVIVGTRSGKIHFIDPTTAQLVRTLEGAGWINCLALPVEETSLIVGGSAGLERISIPPKGISP